jgi:hypothetical protein
MIPIDWAKVDLVSKGTAYVGPVMVQLYVGKLPVALYGIGIDPGRNFGITILDGKEIRVMNGKMKAYEKADRWRYGIEAVTIASSINNVMTGIGETFSSGKPKPIKGIGYSAKIGKGAVEGAAYKKTEGQVNLAEVRFGFAYGLHSLGLDVVIVPPATARAQVAGKGTMTMNEFWPTLNSNAADSIGIAAYAAGVRRDT